MINNGIATMHTTLYLKAIFNFERSLFRADRLDVLVAFILFAAVGYAFVNGHAWMNKQQQAVHAAQAEESARLQNLKETLVKIEAGSLKPPKSYQNPASAHAVGNQLAATYAILPPTSLALTAIGQSDLNPPYTKVSGENKEIFALNEEIENPGNLLAGNFDLAFVVVFLLPILIIALSYNLLSAEREQGTLAITMTNPVPLWVLIAGKLCFRAGFVFSMMAGMAVIGLIIAGADLTASDSMVRLAWWIGLLFTYILFWFAMAVAVNVQAKSSSHNALVLTGLWIMLLLVLPTFISIAINVAYPLPSRVAMIGAIRAAQTDAGKSSDATVARFEQEHPEMTIKPGSADDDYAASRKRVLVQLAASERVAQIMTGYDRQLAKRQRIAEILRFLSPAIVMQEALNAIAGTDNSRYRHLSRQVDAFRRTRQDFFMPKALNNVPLKLADYQDFPRFSYVEQAISETGLRLFGGWLGLMIPIALLFMFTLRRIRNYPVTA
jgi:ABC-2 type transport system permease protein